MRRSLRVRLIVWILVLLLPASVASGWLLVEAFGGRLLRDIDVASEEEAETVAVLLEKSTAPDSMQRVLDRVAAETDLGPGKHVIVFRGGKVIGESPPGAHALLQSRDPALRVASHQAGPPQDPLTVTIAVPATAALYAKRRLALLLMVGIPVGLVLSSAGLFLVIGRVLQPLRRATNQLDTIGVENLAARVPVENPDDEVGRLLKTLNQVLDRLQRAVTELQRFTADAAHELRTPLTVLRTALEVSLGRDRPATEYRAALSEALGLTDRVCCLAEDLLTLARMEVAERPRTIGQVDVGEMLRELAEAWQEAGAKRGVALHVDVPGQQRIAGNEGDLYRLFNNLIDNAVRHSPEGGLVTLRAQREDDWLCITVADDGAGVAAVELSSIFDRFHRGSLEPPRSNSSGLGLSIAKEIVRMHGGDIGARNLPGSGFAVTVRLPSASLLGGDFSLMT